MRLYVSLATSIIFLVFIYFEGASKLYLHYFPLPARQKVLFGATNGRDDNFIIKLSNGKYVANTIDENNFIDSIGKKFSKFKDANCIRIVCLGGSDTYGVGADKVNSYPSLTSTLLNTMYGGCGLKFEVINAGYMGYHSWHSNVLIHKAISLLNPDVVLSMQGPNDLTTALVVTNKDDMIKEKREVESVKDQPTLLLRLLEMIDNKLYASLDQYRIEKHIIEYLKNIGNKPLTLHERLDLFGYYDNMKDIAKLGKTEHFDFIVLNYPWSANPNNPYMKVSKKIPPDSTSLYDYGRIYFDDTNKKLASNDGFALIDLMNLFDNTITDSKGEMIDRLYHDAMHFTKAGNIIIAQAIVNKLRELPDIKDKISGCEAMPMDYAVTLLHPNLYFSNGWPEVPNTVQHFVIETTYNIKSTPDGPPGWLMSDAADSNQHASLILRCKGILQHSPMPSNGVFNSFFYPRVSSRKDSIVVRSADGHVIFALSGSDSNPHWSGISDKFGINIPAMGSGDQLTVDLTGHAQLWHRNDDVFFTNDVKSPGY